MPNIESFIVPIFRGYVKVEKILIKELFTKSSQDEYDDLDDGENYLTLISKQSCLRAGYK